MDASGNKKKKAKKEKPYVSIDFEILKPGGHKYSEIDYQELKRRENVGEESSLDGDLHNIGAVDFIRRLEAKYSKKGKKYRFEEDDVANRKYDGYEDEDGFIDDSEAFEEQLPSTMETIKGGFYVNRGGLELKELNESQFAVDEEEEDDEESVMEESTSAGGGAEKKKTSSSAITAPPAGSNSPARMVGVPPGGRMVGGPPTMKRAISISGSEAADRAAQEAKRKKLLAQALVTTPVAAPAPTPAVPKKVPEVVKEKTTDSVIVLDDDSIEKTPPSDPPTTTPQKPTTSNTPISTPKPLEKTPEKPSPSPTSLALLNQQKLTALMTVVPNLPSLPTSKKAVIEKLFGEFFKSSLEYFGSGKKRLTDELVNLIIKIDEFYKKEHVPKIQRGKLQEQIASYLSIHRATVTSRMQQRITEIENAAKKVEKDDDIQVIPTPKATSSSTLGNKKLVVKMGDVKDWTAVDVVRINEALGKMPPHLTIPENVFNYVIHEANKKGWNISQASQKMLFYKDKSDIPVIPQVSQTSIEKPQRKSRVYLNVWVKESGEFFEIQMRKKQPEMNMARMTENREQVVKTMIVQKEKSKEFYRKSVEDAKRNNTAVPNYAYQFSDLLIAHLHQYLEDIYSLACFQKSRIIPFSAINSLHDVIKEDIAKSLFFVEICRRLPKISFILDTAECKKIMSESKLFVDKFQVVQNSRYSLKWPEGTGPSCEKDSSPIKIASKIQVPSTSASNSAPNVQPSTSTSTSSSNPSSTQPSTTSGNDLGSNSAKNSLELMKGIETLIDQFVEILKKNPTQATLMMNKFRVQYGEDMFKLMNARIFENAQKLKKEEENNRKILEEAEKQRKIREELEKKRKLEEEEKRRRMEEIAEKQRKLAEEKRLEKMRREKEAREKREREMREAREKKEREAREARERKEREERERQEAIEILKKQEDERRKKKEAEEMARLEEERRIRMEKEKLESEKAAERAREFERMRQSAREEVERKPIVVKQSVSAHQYTNPPPPKPLIKIKQEIAENPGYSASNPNLGPGSGLNLGLSSGPSNLGQNLAQNQQYSNYGATQNAQNYGIGQQMFGNGNQQILPSSSTISNPGISNSTPFLTSPQRIPQSPQQYLQQSPMGFQQSPVQQQYTQQQQQNMYQQQQQNLMRQQQNQQQAYTWMEQQQHRQQDFAAAAAQQFQLQRQMQFQQQQQQQFQPQNPSQQHNFQYGPGFNGPR